MNDIARIATTNYVPTDSTGLFLLQVLSLTDPPLADIIRARIKTMGVEEHQFVVEKSKYFFLRFFLCPFFPTTNC